MRAPVQNPQLNGEVQILRWDGFDTVEYAPLPLEHPVYGQSAMFEEVGKGGVDTNFVQSVRREWNEVDGDYLRVTWAYSVPSLFLPLEADPGRKGAVSK